jgi:hypothetical protein
MVWICRFPHSAAYAWSSALTHKFVYGAVLFFMVDEVIATCGTSPSDAQSSLLISGLSFSTWNMLLFPESFLNRWSQGPECFLLFWSDPPLHVILKNVMDAIVVTIDMGWHRQISSIDQTTTGRELDRKGQTWNGISNLTENMDNEIGEIRDSVAILRVGLQKDLEKSLDLVGGAGGQLDNIHEALQV